MSRIFLWHSGTKELAQRYAPGLEEMGEVRRSKEDGLEYFYPGPEAASLVPGLLKAAEKLGRTGDPYVRQKAQILLAMAEDLKTGE